MKPQASTVVEFLVAHAAVAPERVIIDAESKWPTLRGWFFVHSSLGKSWVQIKRCAPVI
ncbi:MAG TPA: hypothetical protein VGM29_10395 [Polyangiaceae bacterium]|jgi:hypothetical protein